MKKSLVLILVLIAFAPGLVFSDIITFKAGLFFPRAQYEVAGDNLWQIEFDQMGFNKYDYIGLSLGFGYEYFLIKKISLVFSTDRSKRIKSDISKAHSCRAGHLFGIFRRKTKIDSVHRGWNRRLSLECRPAGRYDRFR